MKITFSILWKMNTQDFQFFLRVADLGSISQAAKEANIAVSVASQRVQRLENRSSVLNSFIVRHGN